MGLDGRCRKAMLGMLHRLSQSPTGGSLPHLWVDGAGKRNWKCDIEHDLNNSYSKREKIYYCHHTINRRGVSGEHGMNDLSLTDYQPPSGIL